MNMIRSKTRLVVFFAVTAAVAGALIAGTALAGPKEIQDPIKVINENGDSLTVTVENPVSVSDEVEIKNETGDEISVTLDSESVEIKNTVGEPIGVIERPGNASYVLNKFVLVPGGVPSITVPRNSHMQGLTVSAEVQQGDPDSCRFTLSYPDDPSLRPQYSDQRIAMVFVPAPAGTVHIPLADLFVGEGVELLADGTPVGTSVPSFCAFNVDLQMRPLPGGLLP